MVSSGRLLLLYCSQSYPMDDFYCYIAANGFLWTTSTAILQPMVSPGQLLVLYDPTHDVQKHILQPMVSRGWPLLLYDPIHDVNRSYIAANGIPWMTSTAIWSYSWCPQVIYCRQWYPVNDFYCYIAANCILWTTSTAILQPTVSRGQLLLLYCSQWYPLDNFYCYIGAIGIPWMTSTAVLQPIVSRGRYLLLYCSQWYPVADVYSKWPWSLSYQVTLPNLAWHCPILGHN